MAIFLHFGMNTFTGKEWGKGDVDPLIFNPTLLNATQWVTVAKDFGFKRVLLTAKHHDGFCLWPSKYTDYSVKSSSWRNGYGDVVGELADAARKSGLELGLYLSPWDRHEHCYGETLEYNEYYMGQMTELLTRLVKTVDGCVLDPPRIVYSLRVQHSNHFRSPRCQKTLLSRYGEVTYVFLDGAKGEGEKDMEYFFDDWFSLIHQLQPGASIFTDAGPDTRWVGNENGVAGTTCWSLFNGSAVTIGGDNDRIYTSEGDAFGQDWMPAVCDVSIRTGWFWHESEKPKSAMTLLDLYYKSVGRNCPLLLNVPPNSSGLISDEDIQVLEEFSKLRNSIFSHNFAESALVSASSTRGDSSDSQFAPMNVIEEGLYTYWTPDQEQQSDWTLYLEFQQAITFNVLGLQEPIQMGQRISEFHLDMLDENGKWQHVIDKLFKDEATEEKGERARMASFIGAMAIADLVKTTLGPKGMDKILQSTGRGHSVTVTNDGATILKSLHIDNPAAKVLVDISKVQDDEVGDGTTSVVVLAGELLREAEKLVNAKIHPMTIIAGFRMASECARSVLEQKVVDNKQDSEKFRSDLMNIARTTLSSKILSQDKEHFAKLAVDAVMRLKGSTNLESIQIIKKPGGSLKDSFLDEGFILDKKIGVGQPKRIENAKILVANTAMDTDKVKIYGARVRVDSMAKVADLEAAEKEKMREKVQKIISHGINCFVNRQLIYNFPEELFADAGVLAIEHADFDGIERLGLVTGGEIASTFDNPESVKLGHCKLIEEIMIGEDKLIHFSGVEMGQACTIVLRGARCLPGNTKRTATQLELGRTKHKDTRTIWNSVPAAICPHVLDEAERSLHDALCVLSQTVNDSRVLLGGGWPEMVMAKAVDELAKKTPGKRSHAIEAFTRALLAIPTTIADNAGLDSAELIAQLRAEHHKEESNAGIDVITGSVGDMSVLGISESFKVKQAVLLSATEAAEMILRVDEIITCAPRRREGM
ncbi:T-complex protein 1 subunit beta [Capsicum annuum]|nr:T-complex protein 1 subunit beta [Capsicum annuum]